MKNLIYTTIVSIALCAACAHKEKTQPTPEAQPAAKPAEVTGPLSAQAVMKPAKKQKTKGMVHFSQSGDKIKVEAMLEGLKPGPHGFHIHEKGDCSAPDFTSAGGHFNPGSKPHAGHEAPEKHVGDMGNITADSKGKAKLTLELSGTSIGGTDGILGKAVIVHENADDFKTQPTGNAGGRIACGVIEALK
ncbi:superoxide dismutase family protein [Bdellovibrio sp. HCB337]|uniref:superoxide dismutase family protein n=1 Tax=Bdellovibrio sp. HCB337 TaxID=3394358 RepID=UPI0039A4D144